MAGFFVAHPDILLDGVEKEESVLKDKGYVIHQHLAFHLPDIGFADLYGT